VAPSSPTSGCQNPEERLAKADLAIAIAREIEARSLTQAEAADRLGVALGARPLGTTHPG
jgi:predicted XRE-type DNA-binding protein